VLKKLFRAAFTACGLLLGYGVSSKFVDAALAGVNLGTDFARPAIITGVTAIVGIIFFYVFPILFKRFEQGAERMENRLQQIPAKELLTGVFGAVAGLAVAALILSIVSGPISQISFLKSFHLDIIIGILLCCGCVFLGIIIAKRISRDAKFSWPFFGPSQKESAKPKNKGGAAAKVLDTSVIIDGRIAGILKTGFLEGDIIIPEFVLIELRHIADSSDALKRNRGRRGLDILNAIQSEHGIEIYGTQNDKTLAEIPEVDLKLLKLAQMLKGVVVTNDYNLNKVAGIQGVGVLNINELANTLKPVVLPGERMQVFLVKEGKEHHQAVAYLDDGTMIVVENGRPLLGQTINVIVTSVLQTSAGRMIFARPETAGSH